MKIRLCFLLLIPALLATGSVAQELTVSETIEAQLSLIDRQPGNADLYNDLGNLLLQRGDEQEAEAAYRSALAIDPELVATHFNLGLLFQQTHRIAKARREFKVTTTLEPDHAWGHYQLGVLSALQGRRNAAIKSYAQALRLDSRLTDPAFNPHILDNSLAPSATLEAYAGISSADLVPRTYDSPRRIAGLMVPLLPEVTEERQESEADGFEDESPPPADGTQPAATVIDSVPQLPINRIVPAPAKNKRQQPANRRKNKKKQ